MSKKSIWRRFQQAVSQLLCTRADDCTLWQRSTRACEGDTRSWHESVMGYTRHVHEIQDGGASCPAGCPDTPRLFRTSEVPCHRLLLPTLSTRRRNGQQLSDNSSPSPIIKGADARKRNRPRGRRFTHGGIEGACTEMGAVERRGWRTVHAGG